MGTIKGILTLMKIGTRGLEKFPGPITIKEIKSVNNKAISS